MDTCSGDFKSVSSGEIDEEAAKPTCGPNAVHSGSRGEWQLLEPVEEATQCMLGVEETVEPV